MRFVFRLIRRLIVMVVLLGLAFIGFAWWQDYRPQPLENLSPKCQGEAHRLDGSEGFDVLSWNIQFAASRKHHFFYDGGEVVDVPRDDVDKTLNAIGKALADEKAQLVLLQEVDRDSSRTHGIDQFAPLIKATKSQCAVSAPYHRSEFVPMPLGDPLGRVDMHLGVLSHGPIKAARRYQLPLLDELWLRQAFNLKRAILSAEIPLAKHSRPLAVAVTHLSAFSHGDGTLAKQVAQLKAWIEARPKDQPWILAGDFNLLPTGDDPQRLPKPELYADAKNPISSLIGSYKEAWSGGMLKSAAYTYLPFGASGPDRKIDYLFYGGPLALVEAKVLSDYKALSDHLPLKARFRVISSVTPGGLDAGLPAGR